MILYKWNTNVFDLLIALPLKWKNKISKFLGLVICVMAAAKLAPDLTKNNKLATLNAIYSLYGELLF